MGNRKTVIPYKRAYKSNEDNSGSNRRSRA